MTVNHYSNSDRAPGPVAKSIHDHWRLFLVEGVALNLLGLLSRQWPDLAAASGRSRSPAAAMIAKCRCVDRGITFDLGY